MEITHSNSFTPSSNTWLGPAKQLRVRKSDRTFHENWTNGLVADISSQMDRRTWP